MANETVCQIHGYLTMFRRLGGILLSFPAEQPRRWRFAPCANRTMRRRFFVAVVVAGCLMSVGPRCWSDERREVEEDGDPGSLVLYRMARSCTVGVP